MRHRSTSADPGPYRAVDTLRDFRECHGGDRLGHAIVRACRPDPRRRPVVRCHHSPVRAAIRERRPLLAPRVRGLNMASIWSYDRNRVPAVSHRLDCGGHPGRRLIGGQVRQCERAARGSARVCIGTQFAGYASGNPPKLAYWPPTGYPPNPRSVVPITRPFGLEAGCPPRTIMRDWPTRSRERSFPATSHHGQAGKA